MNSEISPIVNRLNALNKAVPLLEKMLHKQVPWSPKWEALYEGFACAKDRRDEKREYIGALCAPWFDGSAFR